MNPVHSSLLPLLPEPGHFHAMKSLTVRPFHFSRTRKQVNDSDKAKCRMRRLNLWTVFRLRFANASSSDRTDPSVERRRNTRESAGQDALLFFGEERFSCRGGAADLPKRL